MSDDKDWKTIDEPAIKCTKCGHNEAMSEVRLTGNYSFCKCKAGEENLKTYTRHRRVLNTVKGPTEK